MSKFYEPDQKGDLNFDLVVKESKGRKALSRELLGDLKLKVNGLILIRANLGQNRIVG